MIIVKSGGSYNIQEGEEALLTGLDILTASCVVRFIKAGRLEKPEYDLAVSALAERGQHDTEPTAGIVGASYEQKQNGSSYQGRDNSAQPYRLFERSRF